MFFGSSIRIVGCGSPARWARNPGI